ncbi:hypothetical protein PFISCL1PPCAC_11679, partial [Pristionchus fissidentatus]
TIMRPKSRSHSQGRKRHPKALKTGQLVMSHQKKAYIVEGHFLMLDDLYLVYPHDNKEVQLVMKTKRRGEDSMNSLGNELAVYEDIQRASEKYS